MNITYREAKRILAKQEEAREIINSYRGMETLGKRLQLKNNKELILKLFEIEGDDSIVEVFTHLKALYEEHVMSHAERNAYMHAMISNTTTAITTTPAPNAPAAKAKSASAKAKAAAAKCDVPTPTAPGRPNTTTTVAQR